METDCGMELHLGDRTVKVPAKMKLMYSDFAVNEISAEKEVLRLKSREEIAQQVAISDQPAVIDTAVERPATISAEVEEKIDEIFTKKSGFVDFPIQELDKEQRKEVHVFVRKRYAGQLVSETQPQAIRVAYGRKNLNVARRDVPDFCHFTLAKEATETAYALQLLSKFMNIKQKDCFKSCGIKDRRAVTTQRISVPRTTIEKLLDLNKRLRNIQVYDCQYMKTPLKLGAHWGNRFNIILRDIQEEQHGMIQERIAEFPKRGFINYFGTQRFGSFGTSTADVGREILRRNWEAAITLILSNKGANGTVGDATAEWAKSKDAKKAWYMIQGATRFASVEGQILGALAKGASWQEAILKLPPFTASIYIHAYQSLLWNKAASRRVREGGEKTIPGDFDAEGKPLADGASHFSIYMPIPGTQVESPNYACEWFDEMLTADGLTVDSFKSLHSRFALGDSHRPLFILPEDVESEFLEYEDERALLLPGLVTKALEPEARGSGRHALRIAFSLPSGTYATVALRQITGFDMGKQSMKELSSIPVDDAADEDVENAEETEDEPAKKRLKETIDDSATVVA
ncbi:unnamed protein product, partial [Mesorhabditis spiculigera]